MFCGLIFFSEYLYLRCRRSGSLVKRTWFLQATPTLFAPGLLRVQNWPGKQPFTHVFLFCFGISMMIWLDFLPKHTLGLFFAHNLSVLKQLGKGRFWLFLTYTIMHGKTLKLKLCGNEVAGHSSSSTLVPHVRVVVQVFETVQGVRRCYNVW